MLHAFITSHHDELLTRCRQKAAQRRPRVSHSANSDGVAPFLYQIADTLRVEYERGADGTAVTQPALSASEIGRVAALHGEQLCNQGFSVEQVVREYGDVCQSVSDLALALEVPFSVAEFRTFNRCLDDAIAGAVAAHGALSQHTIADRGATLNPGQRVLNDEYQRLVAIALHAYAAIQGCKAGGRGATGALLGHSLNELQQLTELAFPPMLDQLPKSG